jgi:uncharacterized membrane protein YfcA
VSESTFRLIALALSVFAGATASVVGFGIGSLLTPLLATQVGIEAAIALVTVPHAVATAIRCWRLRASIDWTVLRSFGLLSAAGGMIGALAYSRLGSTSLTRVLGGLLLLTAVAQLAKLAARWRPHGPVVGALGLASGFFGGIAGNQGGLRAAALTAFGLTPVAFVATATATGLIVDAARAPVYAWTSYHALATYWDHVAVLTVGVVAGTLAGTALVKTVSAAGFARVVAVAVGLLGAWLLASA